LPGVRHQVLGAGTANFAKEPAMSDQQVLSAINSGR